MKPQVSDAWDNTKDDPTRPVELILGGNDFTSITEKVSDIVLERKTPRAWYLAFFATAGLTGVLFLMIGWLFIRGVGVWGLNNPVGWAWDITNFVFWVGIGHAGTLISAILFLLRQKWRTSINRFAEAMTIFAVVCAGIFPGIHVGRVWVVYWLFPLPNNQAMWPNFRSPLLWDVFAVGTYMTVSLLFWYTGMVPDLATLRDRSKTRIQQAIYGFLALGWRNSHRHWHRYEAAYLILAGISTPLVLSVHSIVSFDFATSILPGWHTTIFPPYFVAGAIFGGFAMVLLLLIPARELYPHMKDFITKRHLENMSKIILATGMIVGFAYAMEFFIAYYSGNEYELGVFLNNRANPNKAPYWWAYWIMISCNVISPQVFWSKAMRTNPAVIFGVCILVTIGMWFERFVIIATSLHRTFLPGEWHMFWPTLVDIGIFAGSFGVFFTLFLLFLKFLPSFPIAELKAVLPQASPHHHPTNSPGQGDHGKGAH